MQKMKFAFIIIVLLSLEAVGSYYTFHPDVSDGPNSALVIKDKDDIIKCILIVLFFS